MKAIEVINKVANDQINHWLLYEQTKAYLELGVHKEALICAEKCFIMAQSDTKAASRRSIYHDLLSKCHEALEDSGNAIEELKKAVENCFDEKYKAELKLRLSKF